MFRGVGFPGRSLSYVVDDGFSKLTHHMVLACPLLAGSTIASVCRLNELPLKWCMFGRKIESGLCQTPTHNESDRLEAPGTSQCLTRLAVGYVPAPAGMCSRNVFAVRS